MAFLEVATANAKYYADRGMSDAAADVRAEMEFIEELLHPKMSEGELRSFIAPLIAISMEVEPVVTALREQRTGLYDRALARKIAKEMRATLIAQQRRESRAA